MKVRKRLRYATQSPAPHSAALRNGSNSAAAISPCPTCQRCSGDAQ